MLNRKRMFALLLAAMMLITLVGCGGNSPEETTKPTETTPAPETTQPTDATEDTTPTESTDTLFTHENTLFSVEYDPAQGWTIAEDDISAYDDGGSVYLRIENENDEIMVRIEATEESASSFRYALHELNIDMEAYAAGTLDTLDVSGQPMVWAEDEYGERYFYGRDVAAGTTYTISASPWSDARVQELIENITWKPATTDNIDPPWPWDGTPFSGDTLSQIVGTYTLTAQFVPMAESLVTYETFDHDIAVIGDKVYLLSDEVLYQYGYDGTSLTFIKEIPLEGEYSLMDKVAGNQLVFSSFMEPLVGHDGESVLYSYEGPEKFSAAPDGTWGISWFLSGDECTLYTFQDGALTGTDIAFAEVDSISHMTIDSNYILISGSAKDDGDHYLFAYNYDGELQLKMAGDPDGIGLGSITYATSTANGFLALDGNMREVTLWTADGTWIGSVDDDELFGTDYPWIAAGDVAEDGSILIVMSDERSDESADEVLVFRLTGF